MKNRAFIMGSIIFALTVGVDVTMYVNGIKAIGIFSVLGTLLVFSSGMIWLIYRDDPKVYFGRITLLIPIVIFGATTAVILDQVPLNFHTTTENLEEVGNLLMSRYQIGLWTVSLLVFFVFVMASSMMGDRE